MTDRLGALDALCKAAGLEGAERDDLNRALGHLERRGISWGLSISEPILDSEGREVGVGVRMRAGEGYAESITPPALVLVDLPVLDLDRLREAFHRAPIMPAPMLTIQLEPVVLEAAALPAESALTYARAVMLHGEIIGGELLGDAEAPDAAHLQQEGYDETLDCQCPLHVRARGGEV